MITLQKDQKEFKDRKQYLVALAIKFIQSHEGYMGIDDDLFYDDIECDSGALTNDLMDEFELDIDDLD